jgi:hypothetical protein
LKAANRGDPGRRGHRALVVIASLDRERATGADLFQQAGADQLIDNLSGGGFSFEVRRQFNSAIIALRSRGQNHQLGIGKSRHRDPPLARRRCHRHSPALAMQPAGQDPQACCAVDLFKSRRRLEAENLFLRHQLSIALRRAPSRLRLRGCDRALLVCMTGLWPSLLGAAQVVQPDTILRWHRAGFTAFWRWKSRKRAGRPKIDRGLRDLIRRMSSENPKWGASRIHGELLMLGFEVAQSTVSKYMVQDGPRSQGWKTFLCNHAQAIAAIDLCVLPTLTFERLFAFLVLGHGRRQLL